MGLAVVVELTVIVTYVCAAAVICIIQAKTMALRHTYYVCVFDMSQVLKSDLKPNPNFAALGHSYSHSTGAQIAEFEDLELDGSTQELVKLEGVDELDESILGNLSIVCWLAMVTSSAPVSEQGLLMLRAPCSLDGTPPATECYILVSRHGELSIRFEDGEEAYRSRTIVPNVERMVLTEEKDLILLNEGHEIVWSSRGNGVFNCMD
ncbi:hypothetical protein R1flu_019045 [Riccia fluitans]|uniref:Bulb-type lectin domain-containing protein n=1 Tax=Riccia fluitans TaxID=41844 RepID=A0ABD1ZIL0_9MARC